MATTTLLLFDRFLQLFLKNNQLICFLFPPSQLAPYRHLFYESHMVFIRHPNSDLRFLWSSLSFWLMAVWLDRCPQHRPLNRAGDERPEPKKKQEVNRKKMCVYVFSPKEREKLPRALEFICVRSCRKTANNTGPSGPVVSCFIPTERHFLSLIQNSAPSPEVWHDEER